MARECCHLAEAGRDRRVLGATCRRALKRRDAQGFIVKREKVSRNEKGERERICEMREKIYVKLDRGGREMCCE